MRPVTVFDRTGVGAPTSSDCAKERLALTIRTTRRKPTLLTMSRRATYCFARKAYQICVLAVCVTSANAAFTANTDWTAKLDKDVRFYQPTEFGVVLAGTEKSLYAIDGSTGETLWRRKDISLEETDVAPVPGTELLLLNLEKSDKSRVEAVNLLTGDLIWRSDKIKGSVMQIAVDSELSLIAVVLVKDAKNRARDGFKRRPLVHVLDLKSGDELWKYEAGEVELMPSRWPEDDGKEVDYTLDNNYPPVLDRKSTRLNSSHSQI